MARWSFLLVLAGCGPQAGTLMGAPGSSQREVVLEELWVGTPGSGLGYGMAAGDFDGDGYRDLVVNRGHDEEVDVYRGAVGGPTAVVDRVIRPVAGVVAGEDFGITLLVGDVNGDGFDDLWASGEGSTGSQLHLGSSAGLDVNPHQVLPTGGARLFDVDGDGFDDLQVVVAVQAANPIRHVYLGGPTGLDPSSIVVNDTADDSGDFDGDGQMDLVVVDVFKRRQDILHRIGLWYGDGTFPFVRPFDQRVASPQSAVAWTTVLGDVDGDGTDDLAHDVSGGSGSGFEVLLGGPQGLSAVPVLQHLDRSGRHDHVQSLAVGDLDCDGLADLGSLRYAGFQSWVSVFSAADFPNGSIAFDVVPGYAADTRIVPVGDLDGDGCDDLVVGVPGVDTLWIVRGAPGGPL